MTDLRRLLESTDPVRSEPSLGDADVQRMRRAVIAASDESPISMRRWVPWTAGTLAVAFVATVASGYVGRMQHDRTPITDFGPSSESQVTTPRQLQFVTSGGTRIIWIFNPDFEIAGNAP